MPKVLIIDDDPSLLDALSMALEDAGHTVVAAADGTTGLALIRSKRPDLVVSDVNMPGLDGFSLCRRLREENNRVPFILLTSRDNDIDETLGLELGADDYVTKPFLDAGVGGAGRRVAASRRVAAGAGSRGAGGERDRRVAAREARGAL